MTTYYVIRHKPTGRLLPARVLTTHYDFDTPEGVFEPRLFNTERAAKNCATCWAKGAWTQETRTEGAWDEPSYSYLAAPTPDPVPGRRREDLEVVEAKLWLVS